MRKISHKVPAYPVIMQPVAGGLWTAHIFYPGDTSGISIVYCDPCAEAEARMDAQRWAARWGVELQFVYVYPSERQAA